MKKYGFFALSILAACGSEPDIGQGKAKSETTPEEPVIDDAPRYPEYLEVSEVALFQGVKVSLAHKADGATEVSRVRDRKAPVIAGRPGLLRTYVTAKRGWKKHAVTCELTLVSATGKVTTDKVSISPLESSREDDLETTCNFTIDAKSITTGASYAVRILDEAGEKADTSPAMYPNDGQPESFRAKAGSTLRLVVIPVQYDADDSGRKPDVSTKQIASYRDRMLAMYPAADVEITVHAPFPWSQPIAPNGAGWSEILEAIRDLRTTEKPADDVYYYGAFDPASSVSAFCGRGCVAGLSGLAENASESFMRASVGLGYPGQETTMAHEVGHAHGRSHAPCGDPAGPDPEFPYKGGAIGVWGYDIQKKELKSITDSKDVMGYCTPEWISDYTFNALFTRMDDIVKAPIARVAGDARAYRMASVNERGVTKMGGIVRLALPPASASNTKELSYVGKDGQTMQRGRAHFYPYDHLPGGVYVFPENAEADAIDIAGVNRIRRTQTIAP